MRTPLFLSILFYFSCSNSLLKQLNKSEDYESPIKEAIEKVSPEQRFAMEWLISHMPKSDLQNLSSEYLMDNSKYAFKAKKNFPWAKSVPDEIFLNYVLPYASLNERRDGWRKDFFYKFSPLVKDASSAYEAAVILNNNIFEMVGVIYSTKRPKADQSPYESITAGLASCTGLSFLLIDACRSVGIAARFVGTPMWYNNSGNHSWVEIWDNGWHFTGAAEPTGTELNEVWFSELAGNAIKGNMKYGIFATTWSKSHIYFPMDWLPKVKKYRAIDVSDRYIDNYEISKNLVSVRIRALNTDGLRKVANVIIRGENDYFFEGKSKDESYDLNDHLTVMLPKGRIFTVQSDNDIHVFKVDQSCIIDLSTE